MNKVISGKTILLNTKNNKTFVANDFDEEIQTGSRETDKHIEWVGELDVAVCEHQYKDISHALWRLLDNIDGASDAIKPETIIGFKKYYEYAIKQSSKRFEYLTSDGYGLFKRNITPEPKLK
jgi:hypothetical protein